MQRFEITIDGRAEGDFASQELADAAATDARHKDENKGKQVIVRPKAADAPMGGGQAVSSAPAVGQVATAAGSRPPVDGHRAPVVQTGRVEPRRADAETPSQR